MQGIFHQAHDLSVTGNFIHQLLNDLASAYIDHIFPSQIYQHHLKSIDLAEFLHIKKTIPGATFDPSARDPLPRSHFGTRLAIIQRCLDSLRDCDGVKRCSRLSMQPELESQLSCRMLPFLPFQCFCTLRFSFL